MSKFQGLLNNRPQTSEIPGTQISTLPTLPGNPVAEKKLRGRPSGKRSDASYTQITAYIRKDTHRRVKIKLLEEGQGREFSEIVEDLLTDWLK